MNPDGDPSVFLSMSDTIQIPPALLRLARLFPTLALAEENGHLASIEALNSWRKVASTGEAYAALFILNVYSIAGDDSCELWDWPRFNAMAALQTWDEWHCAAFVSWAKEPWWC